MMKWQEELEEEALEPQEAPSLDAAWILSSSTQRHHKSLVHSMKSSSVQRCSLNNPIPTMLVCMERSQIISSVAGSQQEYLSPF